LPVICVETRHMQAVLKAQIRSKADNLFNHLVGECEQSRRNGDAEHGGGLDVEDQLELARLYDRQVGGLRTLDDAASVRAGLAPRIVNVGSITHQPTGFGKFPPGI
jgi:hypothetical protein